MSKKVLKIIQSIVFATFCKINWAFKENNAIWRWETFA
jgi:hypothetical protein